LKKFPLGSFLLLLVSLPAFATVFHEATDRQLAERSDAVVVGTVRDAQARVRADGRIETEVHLIVEETLRGDARGVLTIVELGGVVGERATFVADGATYAPGERVIALLRQRLDKSWFTTSMSRGKFVLEGGRAVRRTEEGGGESRDAEGLTRFFRGTLEHAPAAQSVTLTPAPDGQAKNYALTSGPTPVRWEGCEVSCNVPFRVSGAMSFDANPGIDAGLAAWTNDPLANINLSHSTSAAPAAPNDSDGINAIYLGYTGAFTGYCDGADACTIGGASGSTHVFDGDTWRGIVDTDILIAPTIPQSQFTALITHELGHAIGLRHANAGSPFSASAIMSSPVSASLGANLQPWDRDAVDSLYGNGPACQSPTVASTGGGGSVAAGATATLSVTANGSPTLNYQWFNATSPNQLNPVGTNSATYQTPPITGTSNYWVRVSNTCGATESPTITVSAAACQEPHILVQPAGATIASGQSASLQVGHDGSAPFTYQWYEGNAPSTAKPIGGANQRTFQTPQLTTTTSYWVHVSNSCGGVDSATATIVIPGTCSKPAFTLQPASQNVSTTSVVYLSAAASGATSYQWYRGSVGTTTNPITGAPPANGRYVNQLYVDLLNRPADAGAASFTAALDAHTLSRAGAAEAVLTSNEYRSRLLNGYYTTFLRRTPTAGELAFWMPAFTSGLTDEQIEAQFLGSAEYFALAGGTTGAWLNRLFADILGRTPSGAETTFYTGIVGSGSRASVALTILNSAEVRTNNIHSWYLRFLHRGPDGPALTAWLAALTTQSDEKVMAAILASDEYFSFGTIAVVGPLSASTPFWVRASNECGTTDSAVANLTIPECSKPVIVIQPQGSKVNVGEAPLLSVVANDATSYSWYLASAPDESNPIGSGPQLTTFHTNNAGFYSIWVKVSNACGSVASNTVNIEATCVGPQIIPTVVPTALATSSYVVSWQMNPEAVQGVEVQESETRNFATFVSYNPAAGQTSVTIPAKGSAVTTDKRYYYRILSHPFCGGISDPGPTASVLITAPPPPTPNIIDTVSTPCTSGSNCVYTTKYTIPGFSTSGKTALEVTDSYTITSDKPFVTVSPSSGLLPPEGAVVTVTTDTTGLEVGSTEATLVVTRIHNTAAKDALGAAATTSTVPVSVSLVAPVTPKPKDGNAPINALLIPAVAHADGIGSKFQSDVRITNTATQPISYDITFTPSAIDGTTQGKTTTLTVNGGDTKALNDVVRDWFGAGAAGEDGGGTLEIRPLTTAGKTGDVNVSFATVAASRTYNVTSNGTFGQFIPAIPLAGFLAKSDSARISLQQIAQSSAYRTNVGFVEGAGQNATMLLTLHAADGSQVAQRTFDLKPFEHHQVSLGGLFQGVSIADGRLEVEVISDGGKVTSYASVLDNITSDPLLVFPVDPSKISTTRVVVPGIAELNNGAANFHSDMRIFNAGSTAADVTLAFTGASVPAKTISIPAGAVASFNDTLKTLWDLTGTGGAVIATTSADTPIVVTARTFSRDDKGGTYGQFIPGVTAQDGTGINERPLQVVQLEQSPNFRSNLGLVEVTGNPVDIEILGYQPGSKVAARYTTSLGAGEFRQLGAVFSQLGLGNVYNGRVSVSVTGGTGRVAAYGSVIDNRTQDPTYVPAQ
jgi:hypothetical protein